MRNLKTCICDTCQEERDQDLYELKEEERDLKSMLGAVIETGNALNSAKLKNRLQTNITLQQAALRSMNQRSNHAQALLLTGRLPLKDPTQGF